MRWLSRSACMSSAIARPQSFTYGPSRARFLDGSAILARMTVAHTVRERPPAPALARHVTCVWTQTVSSQSTAFTHRKAPNGSVELVCAVGSMPRILGPQTGPIEEWLAPGTEIVGVRLRPEAAACVLGLPTSTLVDL